MATVDQQNLARRGACPSLAFPMRTGDGLLVRLRPDGGVLTIDQFIAVAEAAALYGNGLIEISARGSLQIRGLAPDGVGSFARAVEDAGISSPSGPAIEVSPLHGIDPSERGDITAMAERVRVALGDLLFSPLLAPKLSIIVEGNGAFRLDDLPADIRLTAYGSGRWEVALAGRRADARPLGSGSEQEVLAAIRDVVLALIDAGYHKRARDLDPINLIKIKLQIIEKERHSAFTSSSFAGLHLLKNDCWTLGVRPRFGQIDSNRLLGFLRQASHFEGSDVRLAPDRHFMVTNLSEAGGRELAQTAREHGLSPDPKDPAHAIAACAGAGACASASYDTKGLAAALTVSAAALLDGSLCLHLSGCPKGCAHPTRALTLTGKAADIGISLDGRSQDPADALISGEEIGFAIERLSRQVEKDRRAGESAAACLKRLGDKHALAALLQG